MTDILQAFVIKKEAGTEQRFKSKLFFLSSEHLVLQLTAVCSFLSFSSRGA